MAMMDSVQRRPATNTTEVAEGGGAHATQSTGKAEQATKDTTATQNSTQRFDPNAPHAVPPIAALHGKAHPSGEGYPAAPPDPLASLKQDPVYQADVAALGEMGEIITNPDAYAELEDTYKGAATDADSVITWGDASFAANDCKDGSNPRQLSDEALKLAKLLGNKDFFDRIDTNGDGKIDPTELRAAYEALKGQIADQESKAKASAAAPATGTTPAASNSEPAAASTPGDSAAKIDLKSSKVKPPEPSKKTGADGAIENMNNGIGYTQDCITDIMNKMSDPNITDVQRQQLNAKLQQLQSSLQMMTNALNNFVQMMQNLAKMYSDIAMNAIRNLK
jgi:hypothetical protein